MRTILPILLAAAAAQGAIRFRAQEIQRDFGVVYAVLVADINGDGKPDVVAINPTQVVWFENPTWEKHVILDGATKKDNVDGGGRYHGDGKPISRWGPTGIRRTPRRRYAAVDRAESG
jgi:hypothetical protein